MTNPNPENSAQIPTSKKMAQMRRGFLELAALIIIDSADPPMRADEIMAKLSQTEFRSPEGTLYSLLSKLRSRKFVVYGYAEQDDRGPRRCYSLTNKGYEFMIQMTDYWNILNATLKQIKSPR